MAKQEGDFNDFHQLLTQRIPDSIILPIANSLMPHNLKLSKLRDVIEAFGCWDKLKKYDFSDTDFKQTVNDFNFGNRNWTGTIKKIKTNYTYNGKEESWIFINTKLPNDGFIYSPSLDNGKETLVINEESKEFVQHLIKNVCTLNYFEKMPHIRVDYIVNLGRLNMYFFDEINKHCLTIKFEYGSHNGQASFLNINDWASDFEWKYSKK